MITEELTRSPVHKITMSENNELKNKLTNWLLEEGVTFSQVADEGVEFRLRITWGYVIDVVKLKGMKRVVSTAKMTFTDANSIKGFAKLNKKDKTKLGLEIQNELVKFPIGYNKNPSNSIENLESIDFHHNFYTEDVTKTIFFESIDTIRRSMICASGIFNNRCDTEMNMPNAPENKAGVG